jgi:SAM-dependent methyltransferase
MPGITAQRIVSAVGRLPFMSAVVWHPPVRSLLEKIPVLQHLYGTGWERTHPFDRAHGTDTSGVVSADALPPDEASRVHAVCYAGSQPGVLRAALAMLPAVSHCTFVDLGCGKGRALLVASEWPFRDIVGVELSPALAAVARRNAARIAALHPGRPAIRVVVGDASTFPLPAGDLVIFLYHPFDAELVARVVSGIEAALAAGPRRIHVIYYNPVAGDCFDASPQLRRHFAGMLPYATSELGYGPDTEDTVVIWQDASQAPAPGNADARIVPAPGGLRVLLEDT